MAVIAVVTETAKNVLVVDVAAAVVADVVLAVMAADAHATDSKKRSRCRERVPGDEFIFGGSTLGPSLSDERHSILGLAIDGLNTFHEMATKRAYGYAGQHGFCSTRRHRVARVPFLFNQDWIRNAPPIQ
ncbi:hypothetical protein FHS27_002469 [Rhodopirellula rubra]|uniref:Uncharacterized protein n=1 Tax=Aporhodopirellula rubra TaxID=980271 RepID=A0A7W5DZT9_9BACT|nr:hypothetical protein [Aporhodopirellula rubra]